MIPGYRVHYYKEVYTGLFLVTFLLLAFALAELTTSLASSCPSLTSEHPNTALINKMAIFPGTNVILRFLMVAILGAVSSFQLLSRFCDCSTASVAVTVESHENKARGSKGYDNDDMTWKSPSTESIPDGTFNGFEIFYVDAPPRSTIHCVGENFETDRSWLFRSCEYTTMCFDIDRSSFVSYRDDPLHLPEGWWSSTQMLKNATQVAGGSQPKTWFPIHKGRTATIGQFRPNSRKPPSSYYRFDATMLPFYRHPTSYRNPGHLLWDDFLPLYTLLDVFDRVDDRLFLAHMRRPNSKHFEEPIPPFDIIDRFLALMGDHPYNIDISKGFDLQLNSPNFSEDGEDRVICADRGLTGSGLFSDHGEFRWHGQWPSDRELPHNIGRGGLFRRYRRFLMTNLGIAPNSRIERRPYRIIVSVSSSTKRDRANVAFAELVSTLTVLGDRAEIQEVNMASLSLHEQIGRTSTAAVYVTVAGGGSSTAMFLPQGAHLIVFYHPKKYLDWDFWNNFPHIHVHWVPMEPDGNGGLTGVDYEILLKLVASELNELDKSN